MRLPAWICISADSRYKLYINDRLAEVGPSKGDSQIWFQDEIDIRSYLKSGDNVIAVEVLRFPVNPFGGNQSAMVTSFPGLYFYENARISRETFMTYLRIPSGDTGLTTVSR